MFQLLKQVGFPDPTIPYMHNSSNIHSRKERSSKRFSLLRMKGISWIFSQKEKLLHLWKRSADFANITDALSLSFIGIIWYILTKWFHDTIKYSAWEYLCIKSRRKTYSLEYTDIFLKIENLIINSSFILFHEFLSFAHCSRLTYPSILPLSSLSSRFLYVWKSCSGYDRNRYHGK